MQGPGELLAPLLPKQVVFDAMHAEKVANGVALHHTYSMDKMIEHHLPDVLQERPETIADLHNRSVHVVSLEHVHIDRPTARSQGGFYDMIQVGSAKSTRHTLSNAVIVDVTHRVYSYTATEQAVVWETINAETTDKEIRALEYARRGLPNPDGDDVTTVTTVNGRRVLASQKTGAVVKPKHPRGKRPVLDGAQMDWKLVEERTYRQVQQFAIPTAVRSLGCRSRDTASLAPNAPYDVEGYFVVKGTEKIIQTQRKLHINRYYVFPSTTTKWTWMSEIRACHAAKIRSTSTLRINIKCGARGSGVLKGVVEMPYIGIGIPILAVCMVLGFQSAEEVAVAAATGGALSGTTAIPKGSWWDTHAVHTTRLWVLSLLRDELLRDGLRGADDADADNVVTNAAPAPTPGAAPAAAATKRRFPPFESMSRSKILQWIGEAGTKHKVGGGDRAKYMGHLMANEFLPQLGLNSAPKTIARKAQFMAMMLGWLADVARGIVPPDDRDHAGNRQYDTAGMMCATLARQHYRGQRRKLASEIRRFAEASRCVNIPDLLCAKRITDAFSYALSTGNWGMQKGGSTQTGIAQMLNRLNAAATISHVRRTDTPLKREGRAARPRQIHVSSYGHLCPAETPEGPSCGLVEQLAQGVWVCQGHPAYKLIQQVARILDGVLLPLIDGDGVRSGDIARLKPPVSIRSADARAIKPMVLDHDAADVAALRQELAAQDTRVLELGTEIVRVLVNGVMIGFVPDGGRAARLLRLGRAARRLPFDVAVEENAARRTVCITGEAGGLRRPLFVMDPDGSLARVAAAHTRHAHQPPELFWRELQRLGLVEYLSKHEEENMLVLAHPCAPTRLHAPLLDHTHCEVHPSYMLGVAAAAIPFSDHNQAPRTAYYASMCKQTAASQPPDMPYTNGLRMWYPQRPLVSTWGAKIHGLVDQPAGLNVWIAVAAYGGRNQEDSLYVNEDAKNRGLFACTITRTITEDCQEGTGADAQRFQVPPPDCMGPKTGNFNKLRPSGLVAPGVRVRGGDAIIGKTMDVNEMGCQKRRTVVRDQSVVLPVREPAMRIDMVTRCRGRDEKDLVTVRAHTVRLLQTGDKLTSLHGQKGVVGCLKPARDLPYTADGIVPDLIINPHALPSRMTVGQLLESALGVACAVEGEHADGTPFNGVDAAAVAAALEAAGYTNYGNQIMFNGETGERIEGTLFFGVTHYQRVKQMVDDKHHARARGPVHILTEQPVEGRAKDGGFRVGDMERDAMVSHGAAFVVEDRLLGQSDYAKIPICQKCSTVAMGRAPADQCALVVGRNEHSGFCMKCRAAGTVYKTPMPHAAKLFATELQATNVRVEFELDVDPRINAVTTAAVGMPRADRNAEAEALRPAVQRAPRRKRPRDAYEAVDSSSRTLGVSELPEGIVASGGSAYSAVDLPPLHRASAAAFDSMSVLSGLAFTDDDASSFFDTHDAYCPESPMYDPPACESPVYEYVP